MDTLEDEGMTQVYAGCEEFALGCDHLLRRNSHKLEDLIQLPLRVYVQLTILSPQKMKVAPVASEGKHRGSTHGTVDGPRRGSDACISRGKKRLSKKLPDMTTFVMGSGFQHLAGANIIGGVRVR